MTSTDVQVLEARATEEGQGPPTASDYAVATFLSSAIVLTFLVLDTDCWNWFAVPTWATGALIMVDAVQWWRTRDRLSRLRYLISFLGTHMLLIAPFLHVIWDGWMTYVLPPPEWLPWLSRMSVVHLLAVVCYRYAIAARLRRPERPAQRTRWQIDADLLVPAILAGLLVSAAMQALIYIRFGGIVAFVQTVPARAAAQDTTLPLNAVELTIAEAFPYLLLLFLGLRYTRGRADTAEGRTVTWRRVALLLGVLGLAVLLFGGLRGSRANIIWPALAALTLADLLVRRIPRILVAALVVVLVLFAYVYSFFKVGGLEGLTSATESSARSELEATYGRSLGGVLLGDLGRADVQAFLLYRQESGFFETEYGYGQTYLAALLSPVADSLPIHPINKLKLGTETQYGIGRNGPGYVPSSRLYGLEGEALLNFGVFGPPVAFGLFGIAVVAIDRRIDRWRRAADARLLLAPLLLIGGVLVLIQDADIVVFYIFKNTMLPTVLVLLCSHRAPVET